MEKSILKAIIASLALLLVCGTAQAQFGKRLGKAIENAAKNATVRKAEQKTGEAVSKAIDKATDPDTYKDKDGGGSNDAEGNESAAVQQDAPKAQKPKKWRMPNRISCRGTRLFLRTIRRTNKWVNFHRSGI